ncbi:hypothetical protein R1sor_002802 [Riccia sorocarpa]|uniref:Uncharacterized protein n=1 Tax=Riccia sorocarpa TaxID=122646 RepID=A0ABD3GZT1_9MARC
MFNDWEGHCFERLQELKQSEAALKAASGDPDSIPTSTADLKLAEEKLPHVYDPRKLQNLSDDECFEQAKALEPRADQVVTTFTKLKRKKEKLTPKTPIVEIHPEQVEEILTMTDGLTVHPLRGRSARKPRRKKDADDEPSTEPRQEPSTTATTGPVEVKFTMKDKWVAVRANLLEVIVSLKSKKQEGRTRVKVLALEAISGICKRLKLAGRRPRPFTVNKKKSEQGVDLLMYDIPTSMSLIPDADAPVWNEFPETENFPRQVLNFASKVLDDNGFVILFHGGSLQSSQQIADTLDAMEGEWKHFLSYDICNDAPTFVPI